MKVSKLIDLLQQYGGDLEVVVLTSDKEVGPIVDTQLFHDGEGPDFVDILCDIEMR